MAEEQQTATEPPVDAFQAPEQIPEVPETDLGLPAWQKVATQQVQIGGLPRNLGRVEQLEGGEVAHLHGALTKFLRTAKVETYDSRVVYKDVKGKRVRSSTHEPRKATLDDVLGATLHTATMQGRRLGPQGTFISFTLKTGHNFEIGLDGDPLHTCAFCGGHQSPVRHNAARGIEYHEGCKRAAEAEVAQEQRSIADKVFSKARFKG